LAVSLFDVEFDPVRFDSTMFKFHEKDSTSGQTRRDFTRENRQVKLLDAKFLQAYNPSHSGVVRNRLSGRKEGHRLKAFAEKDCRSRLLHLPKKSA